MQGSGDGIGVEGSGQTPCPALNSDPAKPTQLGNPFPPNPKKIHRSPQFSREKIRYSQAHLLLTYNVGGKGMPDISSADLHAQYNRIISDLEDAYETQAQRNRKKNDEMLASAEEDYKADLAREKEETVKTVEEIRDKFNRTIATDRENAKSEVEKLRKQTYDKFGRFNGLESDVLQSQLEDTKKAWETEQKTHARKSEELEEHFHRKLDDVKQETDSKIETAVKRNRDAINDARQGEKSELDEQFNKYKKDVDDKLNRVTRRFMDQAGDQRRLTARSIAEAERDFRHRQEKADDAGSDRLGNQQRAFAKTMEDTAEINRNSRAVETKELRDQLKNVEDTRALYQGSKADGASDAIKEFEKDWRQREKNIIEAYEESIAKVKQSADQQEGRLGGKNVDALREKELTYTKIIKQQEQAKHDRENELAATFDKDRKQMVKALEKEQHKAREALTNQANAATIEKDEALFSQAKAYQDNMEQNRKLADEKVSSLEKQLKNNRNAVDDEGNQIISPAAEAAARKTYTQQYEKLLAAEQDRNKAMASAMAQKNSDTVKEVVTRSQDQATARNHAHTLERDRDRSDLQQYIKDIEIGREMALRSQQATHEREKETITRTFSNSLENTRRQFEEAMMQQSNDMSAKFQKYRQEKEFEAKMAHRAFSLKQNELIRGYEKKLADQKAEFEDAAQKLKTDSRKEIQDVMRNSKREIEDQALAHEQRIAQLEGQFKERESNLTQSYEENLEKIKRSNAELIKKKS